MPRDFDDFDDFDDSVPYDVREEMAEARYLAARGRHWCETCHGRTSDPASPCYDGPEDEDGADHRSID